MPDIPGTDTGKRPAPDDPQRSEVIKDPPMPNAADQPEGDAG